MNTVTLKLGKASIVCRPEDVASIMASIGGNAPATPAYEKSAVVHKAIKALTAENAEELVLKTLVNRKGVHTVFSGLNDEIRSRYGVNPVEVTNRMIEKGQIKGRPAKRGFYITL